MRGELDNGELGTIVLAAPLWLPVAMILGFVWCVGWITRRIITVVRGPF